ncbi:MAG TPA: PIN domain-containing protein [Candidatus Lokiarchaeia archaeon]|nr:PIN domain-containing protein [Candidatus Lokiarchaeia archaeon]
MDTGPVTLYYLKNPPLPVLEIMASIKEGRVQAIMAEMNLVEVFKNLCVANGRAYAESSLRSFQEELPVTFVPLTSSLINHAGALKCQHRRILSYVDCVAIATALEHRACLHTTEKELPDIPKLKIKKYNF